MDGTMAGCLGHCYDHGDGVEQEVAEAVKWYQKRPSKGS